MGTISSTTGLISGLNIQDIVTKLMSIERRPADLLKAKIDQNTQLKTALQTLAVKLNAANLAAAQLGGAGAFATRTATASSSAITATASKAAALGSFSVTPRQLVGTSQVLSTGLAANDSLVGAGTISIAQGGFVDRDTKLSQLNGGAGVRTGSIRITNQAGATQTIDLTGAVTIRQVVDAINATSGINVVASLQGDSLQLTDNSGGAGTLTVGDVGSGKTATDLGLATLTKAGSKYTSQDVNGLGSALLLKNLNDGNGVRNVQGLSDFSITAGAVSFNVSLDGAKSVGDVVNAINNNAGNTGGRVQAILDPGTNRIRLQDTNGSPANVVVSVLNNSGAAHDLGLVAGTTTGSNNTGAGGVLTGKDILAGLSTTLLRSLKGGRGIAGGQININGTAIDLSNATNLQDVVSGINNAGITGVVAQVNSSRNGITITKSTAGALSVADTSGTLAADLNIAIAAAANKNSVNSGSLNLQYISEKTRLADLNGGNGVPKGRFRITDGTGAVADIDLTATTSGYTVGDLISTINTRGIGVSARINDTGDGVLISRTAGTTSLQVTELDGGTTAAALRLGTADGGAAVDGRFTTTIAVTATDKLSDVLAKIQKSSAPVFANIVNDGSGLNPYRLNLTSKQSGSIGELSIDGGTTGLSFSTIAAGRDAVVLYGSSDLGSVPVQLVSGTNTFADITPGVSINLVSASNTPVTVTVAQDNKALGDAINKFVSAYNDVRALIDANSTFDPDKNTRGLFFNETSVRRVKQQLSQFISGAFKNTGSSFKTLGQLGVTLGDDGKLTADSTTFASALASDPNGVQQFFVTATNGFAAVFQSLNDQLTGAGTGTLTALENSIQNGLDRQNRNLSDINARLGVKEKQLYTQFYNLETALAKLQGQQSTLNQLSQLATSLGGTISSVGR